MSGWVHASVNELRPLQNGTQKEEGLLSVLFIAVFPVSVTKPGRWLDLAQQIMNEQISERMNEGNREYQKKCLSKIMDKLSGYHKKCCWCGAPGFGERRLERKRGGGNKGSRKHDHTCWWLMSFRVVRCHLHGWFVGFWSFQIKAPTFDIFRWNWRQNVPYENIEVKCLESGLTANHHKVFCTLSSATCDIQWQWKEKNVVVIIIKIKLQKSSGASEFKTPMNVNHVICIEMWHRYKYWLKFRSRWIMNKMPLLKL